MGSSNAGANFSPDASNCSSNAKTHRSVTANTYTSNAKRNRTYTRIYANTSDATTWDRGLFLASSAHANALGERFTIHYLGRCFPEQVKQSPAAVALTLFRK